MDKGDWFTVALVASAIGVGAWVWSLEQNKTAPHLRTPKDGRVPPGWDSYERDYGDDGMGVWVYRYTQPNIYQVLIWDNGELEVIRL